MTLRRSAAPTMKSNNSLCDSFIPTKVGDGHGIATFGLRQHSVLSFSPILQGDSSRATSLLIGIMKLRRHQFLRLAAAAAALAVVAPTARAQSYPTRPVRIVVGFAAGGTTDIVARLIGQWLSERLGQQFIIENRPGASTNVATEAVARAPADGYTLLAVGSTSTINVTLHDKLSFNLNRDFAMVAGLNRSPLVLEVHPAVPVNTVPEFIAYARANPGKISMASFGAGSISHVAGEMFKMDAGVDLIHVPYNGSGPMLIDLLGGQVQAAFDNLPASVGHIRAGKLRALAITSAMRSEVLPNVPTLADFLRGYEVSAFIGVGVPKNTPDEIIDKLNKEISLGLASPNIKARLAELGSAPLVLSPAEFSKLVADETEKWAKVIRASKIRAEQ
jgi:tripartite-type tricarboxylate transporter receptor subunit TctC